MVKAMNKLHKAVKIILALPVLDGFCWGLYRFVKRLEKKDPLLIIGGLLWFFLGIFVFWIVDIITIAILNKVTVLA